MYRNGGRVKNSGLLENAEVRRFEDYYYMA